MGSKICKLKVTIPVKEKSAKEDRLATLSAVFGPKGIKAIEILKKFDSEIEEYKYEIGTPLIVKVHVYVSIKSGKTEDYKIYINTPSISYLVKKCLNLDKCSSKPGKQIIKTVDMQFIKTLYSLKYKDSDCFLEEARIKSIIGTLKSMGIAMQI